MVMRTSSSAGSSANHGLSSGNISSTTDETHAGPGRNVRSRCGTGENSQWHAPVAFRSCETSVPAGSLPWPALRYTSTRSVVQVATPLPNRSTGQSSGSRISIRSRVIAVKARVHRHHKLTDLFENGKAGFYVEAALFENLRQIITSVLKADIGAVESCRVFVTFQQLTNSAASTARIRMLASSTKPLRTFIYACRPAS